MHISLNIKDRIRFCLPDHLQQCLILLHILHRGRHADFIDSHGNIDLSVRMCLQNLLQRLGVLPRTMRIQRQTLVQNVVNRKRFLCPEACDILQRAVIPESVCSGISDKQSIREIRIVRYALQIIKGPVRCKHSARRRLKHRPCRRLIRRVRIPVIGRRCNRVVHAVRDRINHRLRLFGIRRLCLRNRLKAGMTLPGSSFLSAGSVCFRFSGICRCHLLYLRRNFLSRLIHVILRFFAVHKHKKRNQRNQKRCQKRHLPQIISNLSDGCFRRSVLIFLISQIQSPPGICPHRQKRFHPFSLIAEIHKAIARRMNAEIHADPE